MKQDLFIPSYIIFDTLPKLWIVMIRLFKRAVYNDWIRPLNLTVQFAMKIRGI